MIFLNNLKCNYNKKFYKKIKFKHLFFLIKICKNNIKKIKKKLFYNFKKRKKSIFFKKFKKINFYKVKKLKNQKRYSLKRQFYKLFFKTKIKNLIFQKKKQYKTVNIKVTLTNIFCTYKWTKNNMICYSFSGGKIGAKLSKKNLRYSFKKIIFFFFKKLKKKRKNFNNTSFNIVTPKRIRKKVFKIIKKQIFFKKRLKKRLKKKKIKNLRKKKNIILFFNPIKSFNGCRGKKQIRKKRNYHQIFRK